MGLFVKQQLSCHLKSSKTTNIHYSKLQQCLPPGAIMDFVWKDYSSSLFREIQVLREIKHQDYMKRICRHDILMELVMSAASDRSFYCYSHDKRFVLKTLPKSEAKMLTDMLPSYIEHIKRHETSLLVTYYGLHAVRSSSGGPKVFFVVMDNVFQTDLHLDIKYDLKGTSKGRTCRKREVESSSTAILKDPQFNFCFFLDRPTRVHLLEQIREDCKFLEEQGLMGYSLLLGVHIVSKCGSDSPLTNLKRDPTLFYLIPGSTLRLGSELSAHAIEIPNYKMDDFTKLESAQDGCMKVSLFLGIVDIFQNYNVIKKIEHTYKSLHYDPKAIPSVKPHRYAGRFQDFFSKVFLSEQEQASQQSHPTDLYIWI